MFLWLKYIRKCCGDSWGCIVEPILQDFVLKFNFYFGSIKYKLNPYFLLLYHGRICRTESAQRIQLLGVEKDHQDVHKPQMRGGLTHLLRWWLQGMPIGETYLLLMCQTERSNNFSEPKSSKAENLHLYCLINRKLIYFPVSADEVAHQLTVLFWEVGG